MSEALFPHYEAELHYIRKLAGEFAKRYPAAAARLQLEPTRSADPHVERLIEAFALLAGRVQHKIRDEFPELTDAMLSVLYPHALAPVPSLAVVQFHLDPTAGTPEGREIAAGSRLRTQRVGDVACRYRTCYPLTLWPVTVAEAKLHPPPFPPGVNPPPAALAAIRIKLEIHGEQTFQTAQIDRLRLHLLGDNLLTAPLYELLLNHTTQVTVRVPDAAKPSAAIADDVFRPVGFEPDDGLFPYPPNVFPGYRLLTEYFAYPAKFLFLDVGGFDVARRLGAVRQVEIVAFLNRTHPRLEQLLDAGLFRPGCTPVVNLFEHTAEPIPLTHTRPEYPLTPDVAHPDGFEVYAVESVTGASPDGTDRAYQPFYHFRHGGGRGDDKTFWYATRTASVVAQDRGTDITLSLVDAGFDPTRPSEETAVVRMLCTNRDLPTRLPRDGEAIRFDPEFASAGCRVACVRNPTPPLRPAARAMRYWHLISHLNLNHLSLTDDAAGLDALQGILRLYDLTDAALEPQAAALARQAIDGLVRVASRRVTGWVGGDAAGGFARGLEVTVEFDEAKFTAASSYLFAAVLERFFGLYASVNSFTQTVAKVRQHDQELKRWPPRAGDRAVG